MVQLLGSAFEPGHQLAYHFLRSCPAFFDLLALPVELCLCVLLEFLQLRSPRIQGPRLFLQARGLFVQFLLASFQFGLLPQSLGIFLPSLWGTSLLNLFQLLAKLLLTLFELLLLLVEQSFALVEPTAARVKLALAALEVTLATVQLALAAIEPGLPLVQLGDPLAQFGLALRKPEPGGAGIAFEQCDLCVELGLTMIELFLAPAKMSSQLGGLSAQLFDHLGAHLAGCLRTGADRGTDRLAGSLLLHLGLRAGQGFGMLRGHLARRRDVGGIDTLGDLRLASRLVRRCLARRAGLRSIRLFWGHLRSTPSARPPGDGQSGPLRLLALLLDVQRAICNSPERPRPGRLRPAKANTAE